MPKFTHKLLTKADLETELKKQSDLKTRACKPYTVSVGGVPGLSVQLFPGNATRATYSLFYRVAGRAKRYKVGYFPTTPIAEARQRAMRLLNKVADGGDPQAERKAARTVTVETLEMVGAEFLEKYVKANGLRTYTQRQRHLTKYAAPFAKKPIREITRRQIIDLIDNIAIKNGPIMARRTYATLRKMFRWAVKRDILSANVCSEIDMPGATPREPRLLSDAEIRLIWTAAGRLEPLYCAYARMLLTTAQRRKEIAGLRRSEIDHAERLAVIPASRMKGKKSHVVPLSTLAFEIIATAPVHTKYDDHGQTVPYDCIFSTGTRGDIPVNSFGDIKIKLDAAVMGLLREQAVASGLDPAKVQPLPRWTLHDYRRAARSTMSKLGVDSEIGERCLAHLPGGVRMVYDLYEFLAEKRVAMQAWADALRSIAEKKPVLSIAA